MEKTKYDAKLEMFLASQEKERYRRALAENLELMQSNELQEVHKLIETDPIQFAQFLCCAVLGNESGSPNPFSITSDGKRVSEWWECARYREIAEIVLKYINEIDVFDDAQEFHSLKEYIAKGFYIKSGLHPYLPSFVDPRPEFVTQTFFSKFEEDFGSAVRYVCNFFTEGMPLYRKSETDESYTPVLFSEEEYIFLKVKGAHYDGGPEFRFPWWANEFYIKKSHMTAYGVFFHGKDPKPHEVEILKAAFQQYIGVQEFIGEQKHVENAPIMQHRTRMIELAERVVERYYGITFDINDRDTWPRQRDVVEWLHTEFDISGRVGEAIDMLVRPDSIRRN
jgi:hypothetical protein